jgi:hypothetical protein
MKIIMEKKNYVLTYSIDWVDGRDTYGIVDFECYSVRYPFETMAEKITELIQGEPEERTVEMIKEITIHIREKRLKKP